MKIIQDKNKLLHEGLEQLAEKQVEEMDQMQARRFGLTLPTHSEDKVRGQTFSELFSGLPYSKEKE